jgi:hypothetical protein
VDVTHRQTLNQEMKIEWIRGDDMTKKQTGRAYPAATIAFYGPDNKRASKVVVGIVATENADPDPLRKWVSGSTDINDNKKIWDEIKEFLREHGVKRAIATDGIIGCPHEEGADYPVGTKCPFCPFWRNRNRFTHEIE